jgi:LysM repeat protein
MSKRSWIVILVALSVILALSACQRSASTTLVATATKSVPFPTPLPGDALKTAQSGTQTAAALGKPTSAGGGSAADQATTAPATVAPTTAGGGESGGGSEAGDGVTATAVPPTAVPATKVVVPTATPGRPATYTLQKGEFPFCIARRFNLNVADLLALNGLDINSRPQIGFVLRIPQSGVWSSGGRALISHPASYTVKAGDTLYSIACVYGDVDPNAMIVANDLKSPYTLSAGQTLQIP